MKFTAVIGNDGQAKLAAMKRRLILCLCFTLFWGLLAHGYAMTNALINHDALAEFNGEINGNINKVEVGRFLVPLYQKLMHLDLALPWLVGVLSLLWLGIAVFLTAEIFAVRSRITLFLIAGLYTVNLAVIAIWGSYLHDLDADMFGILGAVGAVYYWRRLRPLPGTLLGALLTAAPLATYQCNFSVVIELVLIASILDLMEGVCFAQVMKNGLRALAMALLGCGIYCALIPVVMSATGLSLRTGDYNTIDHVTSLSLSGYLRNLKPAYRSWFRYLRFDLNPYPSRLFNGLLALVSFAAGGLWVLDRKVPVLSKALYVVLVCLLPLGAMLAHVALSGMFHDLMTYAVWLVYLLPLLLGDWLCRRLRGTLPRAAACLPRCVCLVMTFVFLYGNVQMANTLYLKKDLEAKAFQSLMTQVVYDIDNTPDYDVEQTQTAFIGVPGQLRHLPGTWNYKHITGVSAPGPVVFNERTYYEAYIYDILLRRMSLAGWERWKALKEDPRVAAMPVYPEKGSIAYVDDILVVHMGE